MYNSSRFQTSDCQCPRVLLFDFCSDCAVNKGEKGFPVLCSPCNQLAVFPPKITENLKVGTTEHLQG
jgi:hypothetical protein